ncbi:MAG TPA: ATP-binding protein, partial [Bacteroidales bacterium]
LGVKTNGEEFPFEVNATVYELNSELYTLAILRDITERKNIERKVYQSAIEAEECERSRIAKELHDGLGPLLSACILFLDTMAEDYPGLTSNPINQKLIHTLELSISTVKEISNNISPHVLRNFGLIQALKSYLSNMMCAKNIKIFFHSDIDIRMDTNIETNIYRIITELVNNTIKHACATIILIRLDLDDNGLLLNYLDDGIGFDPGRISGLHKGMGLVNIENRVKTLNGIFSLRTKPAEGVEINIEIANK